MSAGLVTQVAETIFPLFGFDIFVLHPKGDIAKDQQVAEQVQETGGGATEITLLSEHGHHSAIAVNCPDRPALQFNAYVQAPALDLYSIISSHQRVKISSNNIPIPTKKPAGLSARFSS